MDEIITSYVGLDAHAESSAIGVADAGEITAPRFLGTVGAKFSELTKALGKVGKPSALRIVYEAGPCGFAMVRHPPSSNSYAYRILGGAPATEIVFRLPGLRWEHITIGARQVLSLTCLTPVSESRTRITQIMWSDHPAFTLLRPFIAGAARKFLRQDAAMVNLQNQGLAYDPTLLWIDDADKQAKWYQALKREWTASRREARAFVNPVEGGILRWRS